MPFFPKKNNSTNITNFLKNLWQNDKLSEAFKANITSDVFVIIIAVMIIQPYIVAYICQAVIEFAKIITNNQSSEVSFLLSNKFIMVVFVVVVIKVSSCLIFVGHARNSNS